MTAGASEFRMQVTRPGTSTAGILRPASGGWLTKSNRTVAALRNAAACAVSVPVAGILGGEVLGSESTGCGFSLMEVKPFACGNVWMSAPSNVPARSFWRTARLDTPAVDANWMRSSPSRRYRRSSHQYFPLGREHLRATRSDAARRSVEDIELMMMC